ncbi:MAG TPA: 4-alpha-glucanotransferase [Bryobacteraceae bacterium]|nr:4-alpha-glucanotransferase [Bryobacteraceae bacterium]
MSQPACSAPLPDYQNLLEQASLRWGIEAEFWDIWGQRHVPSGDVRKSILRSLGVPCDSAEDLRQALQDLDTREWTRICPPVRVVSVQHPFAWPVRMKVEHAHAELDLSAQDEAGRINWTSVQLSQAPETARRRIGETDYIQKEIEWPFLCQPGYYEVTARIVGEPDASTKLIVAPEKAWVPPALGAAGRTTGVAVSLYGVRSNRNWGCGDFTDLHALLHWLKEDLHGGFLSLNPLHAIENRQPYNISPYLPNSALFRNPLYIDVEAVPEFSVSRAARAAREKSAAAIAALRETPYVEYESVWEIKRFFLLLLFREFLRHPEDERARRFRRFVQAQGDRLQRFATYSALSAWIHRRDPNVWIWQQWPAAYQNPDSPEVAGFRQQHARQILFHKYLQWVADEQLEAAQHKARELDLPTGLYHDLALATDKCGADLWSYRQYYVTGCRVGSPPDGFAPEGQDWAFPPPNTVKHRDDGYQLFIDTIRANSRHGGALRIDHVMRLFRLYWIPDGSDARQGAYVQDFYEDLLGILALESVRGKFFVVGEDLGTVSDNVRRALERYGVLSYKVFYFEKDPSGRFRRPEEYARQALVSSTTHDLPTLAGFWTGRDIEARKAAGLLSSGEGYARQHAERAMDKQRMLDVLHESGLLPAWFPRDAGGVPELTGELHNAIIGFLVQTPSMVMVLNQEDLTKETEQQNLPASTWQYPNWRRKMKYTVEELRTGKAPQDCAAMFRNWLAKTHR